MTERWKNSGKQLRGRPRLLTAVPVMMLVVYLIFFLSGSLLPGGVTYESTPLYTEIPLGGQKQVTVTRWDLCPKEGKTELAFSVSDPAMRTEPSYALACYALHRGRERRIRYRAVLETGDRYVLQMEMPDGCEAVRVDLRDAADPDGETCTLTADRSCMKQVDSMPVRTEQGYRVLELTRTGERQKGELSRILREEENLMSRLARLRQRHKVLEEKCGLTSGEEEQRQEELTENSRQQNDVRDELAGLRKEEKGLRESIREIGESLAVLPAEDGPVAGGSTGLPGKDG